MIHIHFPPIQQYYGEMLPLLITIFILFLYVYFSCNKIEVSKIKTAVSNESIYFAGFSQIAFFGIFLIFMENCPSWLKNFYKKTSLKVPKKKRKM